MKDLGHFPTENGIGRKKTYGIFNKGAQKGKKSSKNKVETVLPDTLYYNILIFKWAGFEGFCP